jgi:hypothetical protein
MYGHLLAMDYLLLVVSQILALQQLLVYGKTLMLPMM